MKNSVPLASLLRYWSLVATTKAGSGHPTSCLSSADVLAVLAAKYLRYDFKKPAAPGNDHIIFSKGHAAPLFYALLTAGGGITEKELMTLRVAGSRIQGHPTPILPWVEVATGSLGQGLSAGCGMALSDAYLDKNDHRTFVLLGDSEMAEGSCWEALASASYYRLNNLIGILDVNRLGQSQETMLGHNIAAYQERIRSFGWKTIAIDGHAAPEIDVAFDEALAEKDAPVMVIARTYKGYGISFLQDAESKHGKALSDDELKLALEELGPVDTTLRITAASRARRAPVRQSRIVAASELREVHPHAHRNAVVPASSFATPAGTLHTQGQTFEGSAGVGLKLRKYKIGDAVATRAAYGEALAVLGSAQQSIVALDAETKNSTYAEIFMQAHPDRFFEMFIAEQHMVGAAVGLSKRKKIPFVSTFAAFLTRAYDQIRMAAVSEANIKLVGSHAGVSIGEDGASQMGLEDLAMMRSVFGSIVLYPSDAVSTQRLVREMARVRGIAYLRTTRAATPVLYDSREKFPIGGSKILRQSNTDRACIVAAGITLHEALKAYDILAGEGILVRVVDLYSVKPIDAIGLQRAALESGKRIVTVEDHWWAGGIGDAVLNIFAQHHDVAVYKMAVNEMPGSGKPQDLMRLAGIDARAIAEKVREFI